MRYGIATCLYLAVGASVLSGCKEQGSAPAAMPQDSTESVPPSQPVTPPLPQAGEVVLQLAADDERVRVGVGEKSDGAVRASGEGGALVFGPYVPVGPGRYTLLVEGSSSTPFALDVTHSAGTVTVAAAQFATATPGADASLASLDFDVVEAVDGVEFRVIVPAGSDTSVVSYSVKTR